MIFFRQLITLLSKRARIVTSTLILSLSLCSSTQAQFPDLKLSDDDLKMLSDYLETLEKMSPKELEELSKKAFENISPEELAEIDKLSKQMMNEMGYDPETLQPLSSTMPPTSFQPAEPKSSLPEKPAPLEPIIPEISIRSIQDLVQIILDHLIALQRKLGYVPQEKAVRPWQDDVRTLITTLKIIDKPEHYQRLALPEYTSLQETLKKLANVLSVQEPRITTTQVIPEERAAYDPFIILGVPPYAPQEEIDAAYSRLAEQYNPELMRQELEQYKTASNQITQGDIEQAVQTADLSFTFVTDAYEKIKEPAARALVLKEYEHKYRAQQTTSQATQDALNTLANQISTSIYQDQLLNQLTTFIKQYEPKALEQRTAQEKAEKERLKEQEISLKTRRYTPPTIRISKPKEWSSPFDRSRMSDFGGPWTRPTAPSWFPEPSSTSKQPFSTPSPSRPSSLGKSGRAAPASSGAKKSSEDREKEEGDKSDKSLEAKPSSGKLLPKLDEGKKPETSKKEGKKEEKKEEGADVIARQLQELDRDFFSFNQQYNQEFFDAVTHERTDPENIAPAVEQFAAKTNLPSIATKLEYITGKLKPEKKAKKEDKRAKEQYKKLWKGIKDNAEKFRKNSNYAYEKLNSYLKKIPSLLQQRAKKLQEQTPSQESPQPEEGKKQLQELQESGKSAQKNIQDIVSMLERIQERYQDITKIIASTEKPSSTPGSPPRLF